MFVIYKNTVYKVHTVIKVVSCYDFVSAISFFQIDIEIINDVALNCYPMLREYVIPICLSERTSGSHR